MATYSNSAREVEMPNGDVVVLHSAPTGGANTTSNIKKFKYDDNGHVTESEAANATDLNLNSYSTPTTGSTAIGTSDDVQTAIGKLDHQSHIDQTNILYAINTGVKNIAFLQNGTYKSASGGSETTFVVENGVVTVTSTTADTRATIMNYVTLEPGTYIITNRQEDGRDVRLRYNGVDYNDTFTINSATTFEVRAYSYKILTNATITPLLCIKSVYDQDSSYQPPALPNYDLTRLEAEDRAALAEVVDSGAKQLVQIHSATNGNSSATPKSDGYSVTLSGAASANTSLDFGTLKPNKTGTHVFKVALSGTVDNVLLWDQTANKQVYSANASTEVEVTLDATHNYTVGHYTNSAKTLNGEVSVLICTKAAFGVSQKFVPYAKSNYQLTTDMGNVNAVLEAVL